MGTSLGKLPDHVLKPNQPPISHDNHGEENHPLHLVNAMLHVSYKDGIPFFTFKSNAKGGILVARKKKVLMPGNDNFECVYAFHCVREVEKRGARRMIYQTKGKKLETRITGQISSTISKSLGMLREFVVFGVDSSEGGNEDLDFLPNNQLDAIVTSVGLSLFCK